MLEAQVPEDNQITNTIKKELKSYCDLVKRYYAQSIYVKVLDECLGYVETLIERYEKFFDTLKSEIKSIKPEITKIEKMLAPRKGNTISYVCSSKECLGSLCIENNKILDEFTLSDDFRKEIFDNIFKRDTYNEELALEEIDKFAKENILKFWEKTVAKESKIDMNVVEAMCKQNQIESKSHIRSEKEDKSFVKKKCEEAQKYAKRLSQGKRISR